MKTNTAENIVNEIKKEIRSAGLPIEFAFLYGSYAKGKEKEGSDIDIAILFREDEYSKNPLGVLGSIQISRNLSNRYLKRH